MINTPYLENPNLAGTPGTYYTIPATSVAGTITYGYPNPASATPPPYWPDLTNNPLHGFESYRFPSQNYSSNTNAPGPLLPIAGNPTPFTPQRIGGVPADLNLDVTTPASNVPVGYPTYDYSVNANISSDGLNEADEMNLYSPNPLYDSPFGPGDLEWLYRQQDVDGASLTSRLSQLAPISFTNGIDGARRRRLFALDSWDLNTFSWPTDNPAGAFPTNSRIGSAANGGFLTLGQLHAEPGPSRQEDQPELSAAGLERPERAGPSEVDQRHLSASEVGAAAQGGGHAGRAGAAQPVCDQHHRLPRPGLHDDALAEPGRADRGDLTGCAWSAAGDHAGSGDAHLADSHQHDSTGDRSTDDRGVLGSVRDGIQSGCDQRGVGLSVFVCDNSDWWCDSCEPVFRRAGEHADFAGDGYGQHRCQRA